jgi:mannose-6-phosphate isomerase-like protein (cupin superfamily)
VETRSLDAAQAFTTKDGSTIRELFGLPTGGTALQSLAEARLGAGGRTQRHFHAVTEEIYFVTAGRAEMELDGERVELGPGQAVAIPPGAWHEIRALGEDELRFLCCCSPPYRHEDTHFECEAPGGRAPAI